MDLILPGLFLIISASYCYNHGRFSSLMNLLQINESEIGVKDSNHSGYDEHVYTPKSGVQICKITDGFHIVWEDRKKLTQCLSATTITKNYLIHLIYLVIKVTSKKSNHMYFKRLDGKFVNITDKEYDLLKLDPSQLTDTSVYFDITSKSVNDQVFKSLVRYHDGVPTLLVEAHAPYKLVAVYDDFRPIWTNRSSSSYVENIIAYFFFARYYLAMLKLKVNEESKFMNFMFKDGIWNEVEYYTFMNKFLRLKHHIPITGHLSIDILQLPDDQDFLIEKDEKYGIELTTYSPRRGYVLNSVLKGDNILWESATERCISIILLKKQGTIYGINLTLMDDHDARSTLNFVYEDHVYRTVSDEDFKKFNSKLVDPSEFKKYHQQQAETQDNSDDQPEVIVEEPDSEDSPDSSEPTDSYDYTEPDVQEPTIQPDEAKFSGSSRPTRQTKPEETRHEKVHPEPEQQVQDEDLESHVLDISDYNSRVFLRNSFKLDEVDTYEYLCMKKIHVPSIIDGYMLIWDNKNSLKFSKLYVHYRKELSQLIKLVTHVKTGDVIHFFKRHNASFEPIKNTEYDTSFQKMRGSYNLLDNSILLNLTTTRQEQFFDYHNEFDDGVNVSKIITKSLFKLSKVLDGQTLLWQSLPNEKCTCITRNKFYRSSELIVLNISALTSLSTTKFFTKLEGKYTEINQSSYKSEYNRLKEAIPFISYVTLNLNANVSETNFLYIESFDGKFTHGKYYPKSGYVLNKVSYGSNTLWSSTRNRCKKVSLLTSQGLQKMVSISFVNNTTPDLYFNFVNGKFVKLRNFIEFDFTLKEYNKSDSDGDQCSFCKTQLSRRYTVLPSVNKIYLNINVNDPNVYTCFVNELVMNKIFAPKDGYAFTDITDGNGILFRSKSDSSLCIYIHVFYGNKGPQLVKYRTLGIDESGPGLLYYLEIVNLDIKTIGQDDFKVKLDELSKELNKLKETQNKKLPLDISAGNAQCTEKNAKFKGLNYKEFKANEGYFFSKVIFSNDLVYSLDIDEDCSIVRAYFFLEFVVLVELDFVIPDSNNSKLFLYRFSNDFITLDTERFNNLLGSISVLICKCVTLDLSDFDSKNEFEVEPSEAVSESNFKHKLFSSKDKYFTSINVNDLTVWKANSDLFLAREVNVYYNKNNPYLSKVLLQNLDHDETNMFFESVGSSWNQINYTEFMKKVSSGVATGPQDDTEESTPLELYDVDITNNINPERINYNSGRTNGVLFIEASLKESSNGIRSVSNKGNLMWESCTQDLICKVALVYYFDNIPQLLKLTFISQSDVKSYLHKHVSNGYWLEIDDDIFSRKLASFESLSKVPSEPEPARKILCKLDTSKVDHTLVRLSTTTLNKLSYNQYRPLSGGSFIEVVDGTLIWGSESDFVCNLVRIYFCKEVSVLSKLFLSNDLGVDKYLYFNNSGGTWHQITSDEFESSLENLDRAPSDDESTDAPDSDLVSEESDAESTDTELPDIDLSDSPSPDIEPPDIEPEVAHVHSQEPFESQEPVDNLTLGLDIANLDAKIFSVDNGSFKNIPFTKIQAKLNNVIDEIRDGSSTFWSKTDKYSCTHAKLYRDNGEAKLAELIVKSEKSKMRFLIKGSDGWQSVDEDVFNKHYSSLCEKCSNAGC